MSVNSKSERMYLDVFLDFAPDFVFTSALSNVASRDEKEDTGLASYTLAVAWHHVQDEASIVGEIWQLHELVIVAIVNLENERPDICVRAAHLEANSVRKFQGRRIEGPAVEDLLLALTDGTLLEAVVPVGAAVCRVHHAAVPDKVWRVPLVDARHLAAIHQHVVDSLGVGLRVQSDDELAVGGWRNAIRHTEVLFGVFRPDVGHPD